MFFGFGFIAIGVSLLIIGVGQVVEYVGVVALCTSGLAGVLMAAYGLWRKPVAQPVSVEA